MNIAEEEVYDQREQKLANVVNELEYMINNPSELNQSFIDKIMKKLKWAKKENSDLLNILEVEDFLMNGPGNTTEEQ